MNTFLGNVARHLYGQYGDEISSVRMLLPNTRSRLFFLDELGALIANPVWQPQYTSIDEIMREISGFAPVDRVRAVVELYKVYSKYHQEKFDSFYFWGEMLLNDFDQIDKYRVDADMLFTNLSDLKEIDAGLEYFNEQQKAVVRRFWDSFGSEENYSDEKRGFLTIWQSLARIYHEFRANLAADGLAYTGMMHRDAADKIKRGEVTLPETSAVAVVGFNALSECEKVLFDYLKNVHGAQFYWDYDDYYRIDKHQEAGLFVRGNIFRYPQPADFVNETDNFVRPKKIVSVSVPSGALQCKYAADFLRRVAAQQGEVGKETAIVLTDESLLIPLLYSIPPEIGEVNVTMGYPLRQTLAYSFVERLLRLQTHTRKGKSETAFYHADVTGILTHPFILELDAENALAINSEIVSRSRIYIKESVFRKGTILETLFRKQEDWRRVADWIILILSAVAAPEATTATEDDRKFRREYAGLIADTLRKLSNSLSACDVEMDVPVFSSLARRMLQNLRVPYEGEPLRGIQVMGILETRNLDFDNVMVMSMNDDNFPGNPSASSSFIPHNLRLGFGLPTPQHHDGVYAYYFYRLLQRATRVDLVYSSKTDENSSGEESRYIYQLEYESPHVVKHTDVGLNVAISTSHPIEVAKDEEIVTGLQGYLDGGGQTISPTALNAYLDCPLKFYFRYLARLKPDDEVVEEVDMPMFGTILHKAMELLYEPLIGIPEPGARIKQLIDTTVVTDAVDQAISDVWLHGEEFKVEECEGNMLMIRDIVIRYMNKNILPYDSRMSGVTISALERRLTSPFSFSAGESTHEVVFSGLADRVDTLPGGRIRIVDYKTGAPHADFASVESLFVTEAKERNPAVLQTLLYSMIVTRMQVVGEIEGVDVSPALYYVRLMNKPDYSPLINSKEGSVFGYAPYREEFEERLGELLAELFNPAMPFVQCVDTKPCEFCDFAPICRRS